MCVYIYIYSLITYLIRDKIGALTLVPLKAVKFDEVMRKV